MERLGPSDPPEPAAHAKASERAAAWVTALEARHLANLRVSEVTRALRALSSTYVERRHGLRRGAALDTAGKRAAFALFYGPLHFIAVSEVLRAIGARTPPRSILDLGCGTGAAGIAWATALPPHLPPVVGIDRHPWAVEETRWNYRRLHISGRTRVGDLSRLPPLHGDEAVVSAYVLNELEDASRARLEEWLLAAGAAGARVLVLEPLARGVAPWWDHFAARAIAAGGRADEWRFRVELPPLVRLLDKAAGLDHSEVTARSVTINVDR